jgi:predicted PurR-regulated permease PerM
MYFGKEFLIVITFSAFLAMLMAPLSARLEKIGVSRVFSSLISVLIIVTAIAAVIILLSAQFSALIRDFPRINSEIKEMVYKMYDWFNNELGIDMEYHVSNTAKEKGSEAVTKAGGMIAGIVAGSFKFLGSSTLVLVFTFLFINQREKYENFIVMLYRPEKQEEARQVIEDIGRIAHKYLEGRLFAVVLVAILYIAGFFIIGLKNALILAALAAIVAIIPYAGTLIGGIIPFFMAFIDSSISQAMEVLIVMLIVNVIDHNVIEPYVAGGSLDINPLFAILILITGYVIWGIAGVILFLPLFGIVKIIFENIKSLHPYAFLLGDQSEKTQE